MFVGSHVFSYVQPAVRLVPLTCLPYVMLTASLRIANALTTLALERDNLTCANLKLHVRRLQTLPRALWAVSAPCIAMYSTASGHTQSESAADPSICASVRVQGQILEYSLVSSLKYLSLLSCNSAHIYALLGVLDVSFLDHASHVHGE